MKTYAIARLDEIDALPDWSYRYRPVRHHFGITSFGVTAWVGAPRRVTRSSMSTTRTPYRPRSCLSSCAGARCSRSRAKRWKRHPAPSYPPGRARGERPSRPSPATTILVFDGTPGKAYDATGWELWAPLRPLYDNGEHAELRARLQDVIAANPQYPIVYNLACSESLSGHTADAIDHLRSAVGASEKLRADAREDSDFDPIRDEPSFKALIGE